MKSGSPVRIRLEQHGRRSPNTFGPPQTAQRRCRELHVRAGTDLSPYAARRSSWPSWNMMIPYLDPQSTGRAKRSAALRRQGAAGIHQSRACAIWQSVRAARRVVRYRYARACITRAIELDQPVGHRRATARHTRRTIQSWCGCCARRAKPGLSERDQHRVGRAELLRYAVRAVFERKIREQLTRVLGPGGFDAERDIAAITVNRWPHGYAYEYNPLWDPDSFFDGGLTTPNQIARRPVRTDHDRQLRCRCGSLYRSGHQRSVPRRRRTARTRCARRSRDHRLKAPVRDRRPNTSVSSELRADCLNFWEVLAQSIAMIGPTITPVLIIPLMYAQAGDAGWLAYVFGAVTIGAVALNLNVFARRSASAGSLYIFAQRAFGSSGSLLVGWCLLWAYAFVAIAGTMAFTLFFLNLVPGANAAPRIAGAFGVVLCTAIAWFLSYRDVRVSTIALLVLEAISLTLIAILIVLIFAHHRGSWIDVDQWSLHGATLSSLALGAVVAIFSLLGFESATSLGEEARDPLRSIPRAVITSVILASLFFVVVMYAEVLGLRGSATTLDKLTTPLDTLSDSVGARFMKIPIDIGAVLCSLSITTAALNGSARALMTMGRNELLPRSLAQTHPRFETPAIA